MRNRLIVAAVLIAASTLAVPMAQARTDTLPTQSKAFGASRVDWGQTYVQWDVGDSTNAVSNGVCGELVNGAFLLVTTIEPDAQASATSLQALRS